MGHGLIWTFFFPTAIPLAVRWLAGALVLVPLYLALILLYNAQPLTLLFALLIVWVADSGAFFAGKTLGRVKLAPQISPGKTWEGVIGGLVAVVLLTLILSRWVDTDLAVFIPFCLAVACVSIVGDLTVSMFKRTAGVKDSGSLFSGPRRSTRPHRQRGRCRAAVRAGPGLGGAAMTKKTNHSVFVHQRPPDCGELRAGLPVNTTLRTCCEGMCQLWVTH